MKGSLLPKESRSRKNEFLQALSASDASLSTEPSHPLDILENSSREEEEPSSALGENFVGGGKSSSNIPRKLVSSNVTFDMTGFKDDPEPAAGPAGSQGFASAGTQIPLPVMIPGSVINGFVCVCVYVCVCVCVWGGGGLVEVLMGLVGG